MAYVAYFANKIMKRTDTLICKICYDKTINIVFQPCSHSLSCSKCSKNLIVCPICRQVPVGKKCAEDSAENCAEIPAENSAG